MTQLDYANAEMALLVIWSDSPWVRKRISEDPPIGYIQPLFDQFVTASKSMKSGDYDLAKTTLEGLPQSAFVQIWLAMVQYGQGKRDLTIASLEELRKKIPNDALLLDDLSFYKGEKGDLEAAIEIGDIIIKGTTEDGYCRQNHLFNVHYNMACWKYTQQAQKDEPDFSEVYEHLEESKALEQKLVGIPLKSPLSQKIREDMRQGFFKKIKDEQRFSKILFN